MTSELPEVQLDVQEQGAHNLTADSIPPVGELPVYASTPNTANAHLPQTSIDDGEIAVSFISGNTPPPESPVWDACTAMAGAGLRPGDLFYLFKLSVTSCKTKSKQ